MARTNHHTPWRQRSDARSTDARSRWDHTSPPGPAVAGAPVGAEDAQTWNVTTTLRYPASERDRPDRRPEPQQVTRRYASYRYSRAFHGPQIDEYTGILERAERGRVRASLHRAAAQASTLLSIEGDSDDRTAAWDDAWDDAIFDVAPTRHRGSARWHL